MNYEELVNSQESMAARREPMPFGFFYRKQIDRKYRYVVELRPDLTDSLFFGEVLLCLPFVYPSLSRCEGEVSE